MRNLQSITSKLSRALIQASHKPQARKSQIRMISNSQMLADKMKIQVPGMGDSITEGTIIEWTAQVGQAVKVDDVIALIETDKVTIDIKAQMDGVLVEHFANVDDEVEVGSDLYMIDTEGIATATATATADIPAEGSVDVGAHASPSSGEQVETTQPSKPGVRTPSIQFLGKHGWKDRLSVAGEATAPKPTAPLKPNGSVVVEGGPLPPMYGRLPFSDREIDDCGSGGASEAPYTYAQ